MSECRDCNPEDIDSVDLLPWDETVQGFAYPGASGSIYFEVPEGGGYGESSYVFTVYPGDALPYVQIDFDAEDYWPADSYNITDGDGNVVDPGDWNELTGPTDYSLNVDSGSMPNGVFGGSMTSNRSATPSTPDEPEAERRQPVNVLVAAYQLELTIHEDRVRRGSTFLITVARKVTNRVPVNGRYPAGIYDIDWSPVSDITIAISAGADTIQPIIMAKELFVRGTQSVRCSIQGGTGNVTYTLTATDPDADPAAHGIDTDTVEVLGLELYVVTPAEAIEMKRGIATNVTIGARDSETKVADATYVPDTKVDLIGNVSPEVIAPVSVLAASFALGQAVVPLIYTGGSGDKEILSLMQDIDDSVFGSIQVDLSDNLPPDPCPGTLDATYTLTVNTGSLTRSYGATALESAIWAETLTKTAPCVWQYINVYDIFSTVKYDLVLTVGVSWDLTVTLYNSGVVCKIWTGSKLVGLTPIGNYGDLLDSYTYGFAPCTGEGSSVGSVVIS